MGRLTFAWASCTALVVACSNERPGAGGSSTLGPPIPVPTGTGTVTTPIQDASTDGNPCPPAPFTCELEGGTGTDGGGKEGGTTGSVGACTGAEIAFATRQLVSTGPTSAWNAAYNNAVAAAGAGGFIFLVRNFNNVATATYTVAAAGATSTMTTKAKLTEVGMESGVTLAGRTLSLAVTEDPFHLAFTKNIRAQGDITVGAIKASATLPGGTTCNALMSTTITLYIPDTETPVPFGGSTVGALLGAPTANVGGTTFTGWAVTLSGTAVTVALQ